MVTGCVVLTMEGVSAEIFCLFVGGPAASFSKLGLAILSLVSKPPHMTCTPVSKERCIHNKAIGFEFERYMMFVELEE